MQDVFNPPKKKSGQIISNYNSISPIFSPEIFGVPFSLPKFATFWGGPKTRGFRSTSTAPLPPEGPPGPELGVEKKTHELDDLQAGKGGKNGLDRTILRSLALLERDDLIIYTIYIEYPIPRKSKPTKL